MVPERADNAVTGVVPSPVLVARTAERALLDEAVTRLSGGRGSTVAMMGAAGVGKSRLAREATEVAARAAVPVLVGRAVPRSAAVAYRPLSESLMAWTRNRVLPDGPALDPYHRALTHLLSDTPAEGGPVSPVYVGEAVIRLLSEIGGGTGTMLVLEDMHWADDDTLTVIEYLADHAASSGLMLVVTARRDEGRTARQTLRRLAARGAAHVIDLGPLDSSSAGLMAEACVGQPVSAELARLLSERSEGMPVLIEELLSALQSVGGLVVTPDGVAARPGAAAVLPASVADTVEARLGRLEPEPQRIVKAAAVLGRAFDWRHLADVAGCEEQTVLSALQAASELQLLEEDPRRPGALRFRHALLRDAVELATFPLERVQLARRALDRLLPPEGPDVVREAEAPLLVELATQCGNARLAAVLALQAARRAFERWALSSAERWLADARRFAGVDEQLVTEIDVEHLRVATTVGRIDVVQRLGTALSTRLADREGTERLRLVTHLRVAQAAVEDGRWEDGERHLALAGPLLSSGTVADATRYELWSAVSLLQQQRTDAARVRAARAIELARPNDDQQDLVCCALIHLGRSQLPDATSARETWADGLALATQREMWLWRARLLTELAGLDVADLRGDDELEEALRLAYEAGAVELTQRVELLRAELALLRGHYGLADEHLDAAEEAAAGSVVVSATLERANIDRGLVAALRGDDEGVAAAVELIRGDQVRRTSRRDAVARCLRGILALSQDRLAAARALAPVNDDPISAWPLAPFEALLALLDRRAQLGLPGVVGRGMRLARAASDAAGAGDGEQAATRLVAAAAELRGAPWLEGQAIRIVAPEILRAGSGEEMRILLRDAAAGFDRYGLSQSAGSCRDLLRAAGVPLPRRVTAQKGVPEPLRVLGVTTREFEVLHLVAEGLTNREAAERLYLSPRTVEKHVERLLIKTGSANRAALAAFTAATLST